VTIPTTGKSIGTSRQLIPSTICMIVLVLVVVVVVSSSIFSSMWTEVDDDDAVGRTENIIVRDLDGMVDSPCDTLMGKCKHLKVEGGRINKAILFRERNSRGNENLMTIDSQRIR